jgi:hypothetical protein
MLMALFVMLFVPLSPFNSLALRMFCAVDFADKFPTPQEKLLAFFERIEIGYIFSDIISIQLLSSTRRYEAVFHCPLRPQPPALTIPRPMQSIMQYSSSSDLTFVWALILPHVVLPLISHRSSLSAGSSSTVVCLTVSASSPSLTFLHHHRISGLELQFIALSDRQRLHLQASAAPKSLSWDLATPCLSCQWYRC